MQITRQIYDQNLSEVAESCAGLPPCRPGLKNSLVVVKPLVPREMVEKIQPS